MKMKSRTLTTAFTSTGIAMLLSLSSAHSVAWAEKGPGSTGGGLSDARGNLLDFGEVNNPNVKPFNLAKSEAFQQVLLPLLTKVNAKVPGSARQLLVGLPPNMEWFLSELPIASSSDECKLVKEDSYQIAKQVDGEVALSKSWMDKNTSFQQAGLILHELIMFQLGKSADECSTRVRRAVRAIFSVDQLSAELLQFELARIGIYGKTGTQAKRILQLSNELIQAQCNSAKPAQLSKPKQAKPTQVSSKNQGKSPTWGSSVGWPIPEPEFHGTSLPGAYPESATDPRVQELYNLTNETFNFYSLDRIKMSTSLGGPNPSGEIGPYNSCKDFKSVVTQYSQEIAFPAIN